MRILTKPRIASCFSEETLYICTHKTYNKDV